MISEQEAREAAARLNSDGDDRFASLTSTDYRESATRDDDIEVTAAFVLQELSRRDAEKAEREKPIDAEWCLANGATCDEWNSRFPMYEWLIGSQSVRWNPRRGVFMWCGGTSFVFDTITTRGQLLDLLRALRVGEE